MFRSARPAIVSAALVLSAMGCRSDPPPIEAEPIEAKPGMASLPKRTLRELPLPSFVGLKLEAELATPSPVEAGSTIAIEAKIVNVSDEPIPVVQVGDGSSVGWREPHLFFSVDIADPQGVYLPAEEESFGRCGNYDDDWTDEVTVLGPGESMKLGYFLSPDTFFDLHEPGDLRIRVHYRYQQGKGRKSSVPAPAAMNNVPAYELVSAPIPVRLERWFDVTLEAKRAVDVEVPVSLDEVFDLRVKNVSDIERSILEPRGPDARQTSIWFEVDPNEIYVPNHPFVVPSEEPAHRLGPGAETVVLGEGGVLGKTNEGWAPSKAGTFRVRAKVGHARSGWTTNTVR